MKSKLFKEITNYEDRKNENGPFILTINKDRRMHVYTEVTDEVVETYTVKNQLDLMDKMKELISDSDRTVIIVSHSTKTLTELCDKVLWLHEGLIKKIGELFCYEQYGRIDSNLNDSVVMICRDRKIAEEYVKKNSPKKGSS